MMAANKWTLSAVFVAGLAVGAAGCSDEGSPAPSGAEASFERAAQCLAEAKYACAKEEYEELNVTTADEGARRKAGLALTEFAIWLQAEGRTLVSLAQVFETQRTQVSAAPTILGELEDADNLAGDSFLNRTVYQLFRDDWDRLQTVIEQFDELLDVWPRVTVDYDAVPLMIGNVPLFVLQGPMDAADFHFLKSWLHFFSFGLELVLAADVHFSIGELIRYGQSLDACGRTDDLSRTNCLSALTAFVVNNYDTMLTLQANRGKLFREHARTSLANYFDESHHFFESVQSVSRPTTAATGTPALTWVDHPGGEGGWVDWRHGRVSINPNDIRSLLREELELNAPFQSVTTTVRFVVDAGVPAGMGRAASHVRDRSPVRIDADTTVIPVLLTGLEFLLQSDSVVTLIQVIAEGIDPAFAADLVEITENVRELYGDVDSADAVHRLFAFLFPSSLELNLLPIFERDQYLRLFLPAAVTTGATFEEKDVWEWLIEYECDVSQLDLGFCAASAPISDSAHFTGTPYALPADGIRSPVAYTAVPDPGFAGLLTFDPWQVDPRFDRGVTSPNQEQLNRLVQDVGMELLQRLDD